MMRNYLAILSFLFLQSCNFLEEKTLSIEVFDNQKIYFNQEKTHQDSEIIIRDNGRLVFKKITIPSFKRNVAALIEVELVSAGDPWDKSGSVFLLDTHPDSINTTSLELLRFITPFGVGHFSKVERLDDYKPVYIPKWEESISWKEDISHLSSSLNGEVWIGAWIDSWHKDGYEIDVSLHFTESPFLLDRKPKQQIHVLANTHKYSNQQDGSFDFSNQDLIVDFQLRRDIKNAKLYFTSTGHGAHSDGDEFNQRDNVVIVNKEIVYTFPAWRDDCASFRRFNPSSGVWFEETTFKGEVIQERIASSDYSRSNWCPGSSVSPEMIMLGDLKQGQHTFTYSIPNAQPTTEKFWNHWNLSYYLVYDN